MFEKLKSKIWFHLLLMFVIFVILYVSFFAGLSKITKHGKEIAVPAVTGMQLDAAIAKLKDMSFDIHVDSIYDPAAKPLAVLKQVPDSGAMAKDGRTVFLSVNMISPNTIAMPDLVNLTYKSAELQLQLNKLRLGDTMHVPDVANGTVKRQLYMSRDIKPGDKIKQGSKITLVIGDGMGSNMFDVPDVTGMNYEEVMAVLDEYSFNIQLHFTREVQDTSAAMITAQSPVRLKDDGTINKIKSGDILTLTLE